MKIDEVQLDKKFWKSVTIRGEKFNFYFVNGDYVRTYLWIDYLFAGYHETPHLEFISHGENWMDRCLEQHDRDATFVHETTEMPLVIFDKMKYEDAHYKYANPAEQKYRRETYNSKITDV
jgi:hypothetical protein